MKVVKVSKPLKSRCHGNTLTYNPRTNRIIACCGKGGKTKIAIINASTLKQCTRNLSKSAPDLSAADSRVFPLWRTTARKIST